MNGIDISSWQAGIDLTIVPCDFVIIKATGGVGYKNEDCDRAYRQAKGAGKKLGVYHYAREAGYAGSAAAEADYFTEVCKAYIGEAILCLDWEEELALGPAWAKEWLDRVYKKTGVRPLIYTSQSATVSYDWKETAKEYGLWLAQYANMDATGYQSAPWSTKNYGAWGSVCAIHQYSSNGRLNGYNGALDLNISYIDAKLWDRYAEKEDSMAPQEPEIPKVPDPVNATVQPNTGADHQRLIFESAGDGNYRIKDKANGYCLTAAGEAAGSNVDFRPEDGGSGQLWKIIKKQYGFADYTMFGSAASEGKYLSVENNGVDGKNDLKLYTDLHNQQQKFYIREESDGRKLAIHVFSGLCVSAKA